MWTYPWTRWMPSKSCSCRTAVECRIRGFSFWSFNGEPELSVLISSSAMWKWTRENVRMAIKRVRYSTSHGTVLNHCKSFHWKKKDIGNNSKFIPMRSNRYHNIYVTFWWTPGRQPSTILVTKMAIIPTIVLLLLPRDLRQTRQNISVNSAIIGSDNALSPDRHQAIIWTNAGILIIGP